MRTLEVEILKPLRFKIVFNLVPRPLPCPLAVSFEGDVAGDCVLMPGLPRLAFGDDRSGL